MLRTQTKAISLSVQYVTHQAWELGLLLKLDYTRLPVGVKCPIAHWLIQHVSAWITQAKLLYRIAHQTTVQLRSILVSTGSLGVGKYFMLTVCSHKTIV